MCSLADRQTERDRHVEQTDRQTDRHVEQTDRQADTLNNVFTSRQTDRQTR